MSEASKIIFACGSIEAELEAARKELGAGNEDFEIEYLAQNLHRHPEQLNTALQHKIDDVDGGYEQVVLGYGLCSNALHGLIAPSQGLAVPRVHDCISFFLGSRQDYESHFRKRPGSYYLTPGWVELQRDPLGTVESDYKPRVGWEEGLACMREEMKNYGYIVLVRTGAREPEALKKRAQENAETLGKELVEVASDLSFFKRLLTGPYDTEDFLRFEPGSRVTNVCFL